MSKISAVIITKNEERNIERCLLSLLTIVDEIIVVDSGSSDATREICDKYKVNFIQKDWLGYGPTKNFGHDQATHEYILSIDADEAVSEELKSAILEQKQNLTGAYSFNRLTNYCGKWIKHSGWYPDTKVRLFPKTLVKWNNSEVHEELDLSKVSIKHLHGDLLHYSYYSIIQHVEKSVHYGKLAGKHLYEQGKSPNFFKIIFSPIFRFFKDYILRAGFLDGVFGFFIAITAAYSIFIKYFYHYQLTKNDK